MIQNLFKNNSIFLYLIIFISIGLGFFLPFSNFGWIGILIKALLFLLTCSLLYIHLSESGVHELFCSSEEDDEEDTESVIDETMSLNTDWNGFGSAFYEYIYDLLGLIQQTLISSHAVLYLKKRSGNYESFLGISKDDSEFFTETVTEDHFIARAGNEKIALISNEKTEASRMPGFDEPVLLSILAAPVIWDHEVLGVIAAGAPVIEQFGESDKETCSQFSQLAARVMTICHRGLRWEMDREVIQIQMSLEKQLLKCVEEEQIFNTFVDHLKKLYHFDRFTFCEKTGDMAEIKFVYGQIDQFDTGYKFPVDSGLTGWLIKRNAPLIISDIYEAGYMRPRYIKDEDKKHGLHSFLGMPLSGEENESWGCIVIESKTTDLYNGKTEQVLSALAVPLQFAVERLRLKNKTYGY